MTVSPTLTVNRVVLLYSLLRTVSSQKLLQKCKSLFIKVLFRLATLLLGGYLGLRNYNISTLHEKNRPYNREKPSTYLLLA